MGEDIKIAFHVAEVIVRICSFLILLNARSATNRDIVNKEKYLYVVAMLKS